MRVHAQRAHQLDALRLDADAEGVLAGQASSVLRTLGAGVTQHIAPHTVRAVLRAIIMGATLLRSSGSSGGGGGATPGMRYLNLRYNAMPMWRLCVLYLGAVLAPLVRARAPPRVRAALHVAAFLHTLRFMHAGTRRAWAETLAGAGVTYGPGGAGAVPLELLNRQHVWRGLAAGALVFAPILRAVPVLGRAGGAGTLQASGHLVSCPACGERPQEMRMPHKALPCECTFCYVCVALERDSAVYTCPRCSTTVDDIVRVQP